MASVSFDDQENAITARLNSYILKAKDARALLNGPILSVYQNAQIQRFQTENASETGQWEPLSTKPLFYYWGTDPDLKGYFAGGYAEWKKRKYAGYPGGGEKIMIATGALSEAAIGRGAGFRKVVTTRSLMVSVDDETIPYAKYAAMHRPFMNFGGNTINQMKDMIKDFMLGDN